MIDLTNYDISYYSNTKATMCVHGKLNTVNNSIDIMEAYRYEGATYNYYKVYGQKDDQANRFICWFPVFGGVDIDTIMELIKSLLLRKLALILCMEQPHYQTFFKIKGMYEDVYDIYTPYSID